MSPKMELYTAVVTSSLDDAFYENSSERIERIAKLVGRVDPLFVAKLAVYARTEMHLRSVPLLLLVLLARLHNGDSLIRRTVPRVVLRADEITELLACYQRVNSPSQSGGKDEGGKTLKKLNRLSRQLQEGLKATFNNFDEYQFAKYDRKNKEIKLRDALFLVHPKAKDEAQQEIFDRIASGKLSTPYTWETEISALGQQSFKNKAERERAFTAKWEELIFSGKLGYMALLRNLCNILLCTDISAETIQTVCSSLSNPAAVAKAKQLPFRYLSAYRQIKELPSRSFSAYWQIEKTGVIMNMNAGKVLDALEAACQASAANIKGFDKDTSVVLACDVSGSMYDPISSKSSVKYYDIGLMLAMLLQSRCERFVSGIFGDIWKPLTLPTSNVLANTMEMYKREGEVGYSTNGHKVIMWLIEHRMPVDKVMFFTDCEMWNSGNIDKQKGSSLASTWRTYKKMAPGAKLYIFDLAGYGDSPISLLDNDVYLIGGWSDRVFDMLEALDNGSSAINEIEKIEI